MTTEETGNVDAALAALEQRAKDNVRRKRWLLPVVVATGVGVGTGVSRLSPDDNHGHAHHHHSTAGLIIALTVSAAVLVGAGIAAWKLRRRAGLWSYWTNPPLVAGLDRQGRRTVRRDIRRCTPNSDPVLRAVEERTAARLARLQPRWTLWIFPALPVLMAVNAVLPGRSSYGRMYYAISTLVFIVIGVAAFRQRRGVDRFLLKTG